MTNAVQKYGDCNRGRDGQQPYDDLHILILARVLTGRCRAASAAKSSMISASGRARRGVAAARECAAHGTAWPWY